MPALNPSASKALFSGNTSVKLTGCSVMSDSLASDALKVQGSAGLHADCLITVGGLVLNNPVTTVCKAPARAAAAVAGGVEGTALSAKLAKLAFRIEEARTDPYARPGRDGEARRRRRTRLDGEPSKGTKTVKV
ncbi:hypothetical protein [Mesorhizobium sp. WSM3879]|uniref:hypothetical protein n=1 Tax=Mesorhizobium sp. WSM3879 TaxID=2029406 RepID=UPI001FE02AFF|nr:hypothetical protein [Mesorhizobium sp. WSM3879]